MDGIIGYKVKIITTPSCQSVMRVKKYSHIPYSFAYSLLISLEIYLLHIQMQIYRTGIIQQVSSEYSCHMASRQKEDRVLDILVDN